MRILGDCYLAGKGMAQNYEAAMDCYKKAAENYNDTALYNIGVLYCNGLGVEKDYERAVHYFRRQQYQVMLKQ